MIHLCVVIQLNLDSNRVWGDVTACAIAEALESGYGRSLIKMTMNSTGLGRVGYDRMYEAVRARRHNMTFQCMTCEGIPPGIMKFGNNCYSMKPIPSASPVHP